MPKTTLREIFSSHQGKLSDKWNFYLVEYERLIAPYVDRPVRLLEIGVQNGGSIEIWSKVFENSEKIVGCDIDPKCGLLTFEDPQISIVVGDVSISSTRDLIRAQSLFFDIIIDDGSHKSSDIVKVFANYFGIVSSEGVFIAEDPLQLLARI